jgi:hypothetical protein
VTSTAVDLHALVRRLVESWNQRDEAAFAALFEAVARHDGRWLIETLEDEEEGRHE